MRNGDSGTFSSTRLGLNRSNRLFAGILIGAFFCLSVVWFLFVSGFFTVTSVDVNDLHAISRGEVASTTWEILDNGPWRPWDDRNILLIDKKWLAEQLKTRLFAESVSVDKVYPNILRLKISERQRSVVLASKDQLLVIDMNGLVTGEAGETAAQEARDELNSKLLADSDLTPLIASDLPEFATAGYQVTDQARIKEWIQGYRLFISSGLKFRYLRLSDPASQTLKMVSDQGYEVIFDLLQPLEPQIETYKKFLQSKPVNAQIHEYVDVRVPGRLYVK